MMKMIETINRISDYAAGLAYTTLERMAQKSRASLARRQLIHALVQSEAIK